MSLPPPPLNHHPRVRGMQREVQTAIARMRMAHFAAADAGDRGAGEEAGAVLFEARGAFYEVVCGVCGEAFELGDEGFVYVCR